MDAERKLVLIGGGDHARVILDVARALGHEPVGYVSKAPSAAIDLERLGNLDAPSKWMNRVNRFVVAVGDNRTRARLFDQARQMGLSPMSLVHPTAMLLPGSAVDDGAQICAGVIIGLDARVGTNAIVNTAASVDHDSVVGTHAFVGPGAHLAGRVTVEQGGHVGIGAAVREGRTIGAWALVAAGAAVIEDVPDGARVGGVPARSIAR